MKPIIVFAPGAWHQPSCFDRIRHALHQRGYATDAVSYPSVGYGPNKTLSDDTIALRQILENVAGTGAEIVLVLHSYGGTVGSNAVDGLGVRERARQKKNGGVIMVVYMAAFAIPKGKSLRDISRGSSWVKYEVSCHKWIEYPQNNITRPEPRIHLHQRKSSIMICHWTSSGRRFRI